MKLKKKKDYGSNSMQVNTKNDFYSPFWQANTSSTPKTFLWKQYSSLYNALFNALVKLFSFKSIDLSESVTLQQFVIEENSSTKKSQAFKNNLF